MISCASRMMSTVCWKDSTSNEPSGRRNFIRFSDARLHAESSTCMYSEHGLDALMRPEFGDVCHWLIVVSYCTPGSAQRHAASEISRISSRALTGSPTGSPVARAIRCQSSSFSTACMNSSVTRTELLAFWYWIDWKPSPSIDMSNPASRSAAAFSSSLALHQMKSRMSGWSTSSTTILAARRVLPPDLIVPAQASAPRMKETGPDASPPLPSCSLDERMVDRLMPDPEPPLKIMPSSTYQLRIDGMVSSTDRMKQLWTRTLFDRYSPLSVWMSKTGCTPLSSTVTISSSRRDGHALPSRSSEASRAAAFLADRNPTLEANVARSDRMLIWTSWRS